MVYVSQSPLENALIGVVAVILLVFFADKVINRCISLSKKLGISQIFIGLTVISIGTSLPEITTHVVASFGIVTGTLDPFIASSTVLGTNIGSDVVQQNFIIGIVGFLGVVYGTTIGIRREFLKKDFLIMILAAVLLLLFAINKNITRLEGFALVAAYIAYLWFLWNKERRRLKEEAKDHAPREKPGRKGIAFDMGYISAGIIIIIISAEFILEIAEFFVSTYGIGGSLLGIITIGIATALPELTTSVTAILRGAASISIGTLVGSNITNPTLALGLGAMISTYQVPKPIIIYDLPVKIGTAVLIMLMLWKTRAINRKEAVVMIAMYLVYIAVRVKYFAIDT